MLVFPIKQQMKSKSKTLKYPTQSALQNHRLEQVLPSFITRGAFNVPPLPKTLEFYRTGQFIWNNPYRSSKKTYRYYHQKNKDNQPRLEQMKKLEMTDRQKGEQQRIQYVRDLRNVELDKLRARKLQRKMLEKRCRGSSQQNKLATLQQNFDCLNKQHSQQPQECETNRQIYDLIRSQTLKNRELLCSRLKKRHELNSQLMMRAGVKTGWNWTTIRFDSLDSEEHRN